MRLAAQQVHQHQTNQTSLKLPISHQQTTPTKHKMKFNWRANWEILLVFVIIIVGIVITTIAAIRSKDKHLQATQDESAVYGSGIVDLTSAIQVPPLPQTDFQLQNGPAGDGGGVGNTANIQEAADEPASPTKRPPRSGTPASNQAVYRGDRKRSHPAVSPGDRDSTSASDTSRPAPPTNIAEAIVASPVKIVHYNNRQASSSSANAPTQSNHMTQSAGLGRPSMQLSQHDNYEATSTEPTPSQVLRSPSNNDGDNKQLEFALGGQQGLPKPATGRRNTAESKQQRNLRDQAADMTGQLNSNNFNDQPEAQYDSGATHRARPGSGSRHHLQNQDQPIPQITPMQGPYELTSLHQQQHQNQNGAGSASRNSFMKPEVYANKIEQTMPSVSSQPTMLDSDEMMTSYTRVPQDQLNNLTDSLLRGDYNYSNSFATKNNTSSPVGSSGEFNAGQLNNTSDEEPPFGASQSSDYSNGPSATSGNTLPLGNHRAYTTSLPFAMLLNDLVRMSRQQQPLVDSQANLDQPANSRPQYGILQQLRSLPSPLLALFQQAGAPQNIDNYHLPTHDASESNQHYQRVSMTPYSDLNSLVSRSLRQTNPLPAFPPPKGVPMTWVPSNMGGVSVLQEAASSNADFVAAETAGFIRGVSTVSGGGGLQMAASDVSTQEQAATAGNTNQNSQATSQSPNMPETNNNQRTDQQPQPARQQQADNVQQQQQPSVPVQNNNNNNMYAQSAPKLGISVQQAAPPTPVLYMPSQATSEISGPNLRVPSSSPSSLMAFNTAPMQQQQHQQQQQRIQYINQNKLQQRPAQSRSDVNVALRLVGTSGGLNQAGQMAMSSSSTAQTSMSSPVQKQMTQLKLPDLHQASGPHSQPIQLNAINRVRRSAEQWRRSSGANEHASNGKDDDNGVDEEEDEEYLDSGPVSIVTTDGTPMRGDVRLMRTRPPNSSSGEPPNDQTNLQRPALVLAQASSQRQVNHADLNESALHHYASSRQRPTNGESNLVTGANSGQSEAEVSGTERRRQANVARSYSSATRGNERDDEDGDRLESSRGSKRNSLNKKRLARPSRKQQSRMRHKKLAGSSSPKAMQPDAAGSRLMSKLLGVASTNDELEDDMDGDDYGETANERRKEELEDAEFGIVNDDRSNGPSSSSGGTTSSNDIGDGGGSDNNDVSRLTQDVPSHNPSQEAGPSELPVRSAGSTDSNAYARRHQQQQHQQRSDVEFYGHPGEETRQLKYGILGSGNYEVVNGGIYPDIDESTAAVNSVANYVRKPGGGLLAGGGLQKLMSSVDEARQAGVPLDGNQLGGFMRGASAANPGGMTIGLFPPHPATAFNKVNSNGLTNPLLDMLDAAHVAGAGQDGYFDPNLVAHLGSSGTSARTTHTSREQDNGSNGGSDDDRGKTNDESVAKTKRKRRPKQKHQQHQQASEDEGYASQAPGNDHDTDPSQGQDHQSFKTNKLGRNKNDMMTTMETLNDANNRIRSSSGGNDVQQSPARKMNQFYSYHILPSKKVTIFSDQDLDSAPNEQIATYLRPNLR